MARYARVSGAVFTLLALVQLTRTVLGWPIEVAGVAIPLWVSGLAFAITASLALWAFRAARTAG